MERKSSWFVVISVVIILNGISFIEFSAYGVPQNFNIHQHIPSWVKNLVKWYDQNKILPSEFNNAIEFLIDNKIIKNEKNSDKIPPIIAILSPATNSKFSPGNLLIQGTSSDKGDGVLVVQVRIDTGAYSNAIPNSSQDWSSWSSNQIIETIGSHKIEAIATDLAGNQKSNAITITIKDDIDTLPPTITVPLDVVLESNDDFTIVNLGTPITSDLVDPSPTVTNNSPVSFPLGITTVKWTATDFSGNSASAFQTVTINETPTDKFGISKLYPTKIGGPRWFMNGAEITDDLQFTTIPPPSSTCGTPSSCTLLYKNMQKNNWHAARKDVPVNEGIRMVIKSPSDNLWLNTEMTGYYRLNQSIFYPQEFVHVLRSGTPHALTCQGYSYYAGIGFDGIVAKVQKALYHGGDGKGYSQTFYTKGVTVPLDNRWIGLKTVSYNLSDSSGVKIEIWLDDLANNNWRKVYEQTDNGWAVQGDPSDFGCINLTTGLPRSSHDIILWGGTEQQFRADNSEIDFNYLSIREIIPPN